MSSKIMMVRSYGSSIRSLIQTRIRPAAAATMIRTQPPVSIYNGPNVMITKPVLFDCGFCSNAGGGGGHCENSDLNDVKNEDYESDEMKFVLEGADDDDVDDENDDYVTSEDDGDDYYSDSEDTDASDDDRGKYYK